MTSDPTAIDIFVISVFKRNLSLNLKSIKQIIKKEIKQKESECLSNMGGEQFHLSPDLFLDLKNNIIENSYSYLGHLGYSQKELYLNAVWVNINGYKDYNLIHNHGNSLLSGVFYVEVPEHSGKITFINPSQRIDLYDNHIEPGYTPYNSAKWGFIPKENELFLFPSWLNHYVEPNLNKKQKRISIAFNLNYKINNN